MLDSLVVRHRSAVIAVDCTPNGHTVVTGTTCGDVGLFDARLGDVSTIRQFPGEVWAVSIDAIGETLVVGTAQKSPKGGVFFWIARDGTILFEHDLQSPIWGVSISPSGRYAACSTWTGDIAVYERQQDRFELIWRNSEPLGDAGVYGITIDDNRNVVASIYERGLFVIAVRSNRSSLYEMATGLFHISRLTAAGTVLVGRRDGDFCEFDVQGVLDGTCVPEFSPRLMRRSISGVASSRDRTVKYAAGFDGTLVAVGSGNRVIWTHYFSCELWAVATSYDGSCVSVACGDGTVHVFHQEPGAIAIVELEAWAVALREGRVSVRRFAHEIARLGAYDFGFDQISQLRSVSSISGNDAIEFAKVAEHADDMRVVYRAGVLYQSLSNHKDAIRSFQLASSASDLYTEALNSAARCFGELGLLDVRDTLVERASAPVPNAQEITLLYDLGRMYEESGQSFRAKRSYECVVGWDVSYSDASERLDRLISATRHNEEIGHTAAKSISQMLGPNVPRPTETDGKLFPVLEARTRGMRLSDSAYKRRLNMAQLLQRDGAFAVHRESALNYDIQAYLKYESASVEDNSKKHLEAVNLLAEINLDSVGRSLDVGTATCRYPVLLERLGVLSFGVDVSSEGYGFHRSAEGLFSRFVQGDGRALPFESSCFDLITCMMGTFNHFINSDIPRFLSECKRVLRPGGSVVIGCWDVECPYLSYLSMYSAVQQSLLQAGGITQANFLILAAEAGFSSVRLVPFCFFSDRLICSLRLESVESHDAEMLVDMDFALQVRFGMRHGQMYLAVCQNT